MKRKVTGRRARQPTPLSANPLVSRSDDEFMAEIAAKIAAEPDLQRCLQAVRFDAFSARHSLQILPLSLSRAEALVTQQPLPMDQALVIEMRAWRETLRMMGPVIEAWDESQVCLKACAHAE